MNEYFFLMCNHDSPKATILSECAFLLGINTCSFAIDSKPKIVSSEDFLI